MMVDEQKKAKNKKPTELKKGEKWCDGCNKVVKVRNFNSYFGICHDCEDNCGHK